jgi:hypothetical protein
MDGQPPSRWGVTALLGATVVIFGVWLNARTEERFLIAELVRKFTVPTADAFQC